MDYFDPDQVTSYLTSEKGRFTTLSDRWQQNRTRLPYPRRAIVRFEMTKDYVVEFVRDRRVTLATIVGSVG